MGCKAQSAGHLVPTAKQYQKTRERIASLRAYVHQHEGNIAPERENIRFSVMNLLYDPNDGTIINATPDGFEGSLDFNEKPGQLLHLDIMECDMDINGLVLIVKNGGGCQLLLRRRGEEFF